MEVSSSWKQITAPPDIGLVDKVFSWTLEDVFNEDLYKHKMEKIPKSFQSVDQYLGSYVLPLLEETRAELCSSLEVVSKAPFAEVISQDEAKPYGSFLYDLKVDSWRNRSAAGGKDSYKPKPGDILILSDAVPEIVSDLERFGRTWNFAVVTKVSENDSITNDTKISTDNDNGMNFKIKTSQAIEIKEGMKNSLFAVFLINITTNSRIWISLRKIGNMKILKEVLCPDSLVEETSVVNSSCNIEEMHDEIAGSRLSLLNKSQSEAIQSCISTMKYNHKSTVKLIWGPPGTGKTKTVSMLLCTLMRMKFRTLACAPTNVAITELSVRVLNLVRELGVGSDTSLCSLGNLLLFGNNDRLRVDGDLEEIFLDYRVDRLLECFVPLTGWRHCFASMIDFLESCVPQYHIFLENESYKEEGGEDVTSFLDFTRKRYNATASSLKRCLTILNTHLPANFLLQHNFQTIVRLLGLLESFELYLSREDVVESELEEIFAQEVVESASWCETAKTDSSVLLCQIRSECLFVLRSLHKSLKDLNLPNCLNKYDIRNFCFQTASLIFCTASSSFKLHSVPMQPLDLVVLDEAAQLKECESTIPLQISGIRHAFLIGDELQLPAMVNSKVSKEAGFGRSLFERLSSMGCPKLLLNMQYRMNPEISCFPNSNFYENMILDAPNVKSQGYEKRFIQGPMFGPYSFISVPNGKEEFDDVGHSRKNMVEVAVVITILRNLFKEWKVSQEKVSIGIISPYAAQVAAIQEKLGQMYEKIENFDVRVRSVDGFQGSEEDIIIISTVRSNNGGAVGFLADPQRANVALTRAKHCLWILGNGRTLSNSESVWAALVKNAKDRNCFFHAEEDKGLANAIIQVKKELDQLDDLLNGDSILFIGARWKVLFSDMFRKSFGNMKSSQLQKSIINLLLKLSSGWRPKMRNACFCEKSSQLVHHFKVEGLYLISTVDIKKEVVYTQVLKIWDIIPLDEMPNLIKRLDNIFGMFTEDFINRCKVKCIERKLEVPMTWGSGTNIVRFKSLSSSVAGDDLGTTSESNAKTYVENSRVSDSLLHMKFYALSSGVVNHLLSSSDGRELDLPFEVTEHEQEIINFPRSTFILGRSGTGKTTVLTMKLIKKEQQYYFSSKGLCDGHDTFADFHAKSKISENLEDSMGTTLRQLFVTVSPKLCAAIKTHISSLLRFTCGGSFQPEHNALDMHEIDDTTQFMDIPDSFVEIAPKSYPLVVTFQKFLLMLDGSMENSYFDRFHDAREPSLGKSGLSSSISLQVFVRTNEVNFDRFNSSYWPHFNSQLTKKLDSSTVFTEIISYIKGGLKAGKICDGKLKQEDYVSLSEGRASLLNRNRREDIYDIFLDYEKKKLENGHFDMADFVNDLHTRLRQGLYNGELIDFVYIDEVQDLTMRQIALFKYICRNVIEGFVFSGDTAQTIARGVDFRFQDIKSLFYNEFILGSRIYDQEKLKEKDQPRLSDIFHLNQNFRTHAGVLNLSQCVIELLYHYFPCSVDILSPETSLIYGEAPVLLESGNNDNAIVTIFGNSGTSGGSMVGFGAEQVILVRDDCTRKEIADYVGKQALILTILECKGLEFQDVLLYNFFGTSPLKNQWRVVYEFMKEKDMLDSTAPRSFPKFDEGKHSILCSELKQLYVAITRTRQRLWICDNMDDLSRPMFDYWKRLGHVQTRQLDDSLAQAMQVASSKEEWSSRGIKLFNEGNFEMATMCFERAGDSYRERWARAAVLRSSAERLRASNYELARISFLQAAEIYEAISKAELAAKCYIELKEFKRAGTLYLEKCGESRLEEAGDCFSLSGCWSLAADVFARGKYFSKCLSVCLKGELFEMGLNFIKHWKENESQGVDMVIKSQKDLEEMEQDFLERCALHYHELKDTRTMMKFVREFHSVDSIRTFLRSCRYLNELLIVEEENENYVEAASIAREKGDILVEADLLAKGAHYEDASNLILSYVLGTSLWATGSKGWPLKYFKNKEEILLKARQYAMKESELFNESVCLEAGLLSNQEMSLLDMGNSLSASEKHANPTAEIISAWKVLDAHFNIHPSKYDLSHKVVFNSIKCAKISESSKSFSIESLIFYWNFWRGKIGYVLEYLQNLGKEHEISLMKYGEFCMRYLGVRKEDSNNYSIYLGITDAYWIKGINGSSLRRRGDLVCLDACQFATSANMYWLSQVLSVGLKVLETLDTLKFSAQSSSFMSCQGTIVLHIFEIAKYIMELNDWKYHSWALPKLRNFRELSGKNFFDIVCPRDWRQAMAEYTVSLRGNKLGMDLLKEIIVENIESKSSVTLGQIGRIVMLLFVSWNLPDELYDKVAECFSENKLWKSFVIQLRDHLVSNVEQVSLVHGFKVALQHTYSANWRRESDYISPHCFIYLVERLLFLVSCNQKNFFTTKSSLIEILGCEKCSDKLRASSVTGDCHEFIADIVHQTLFNRMDTFKWLSNSNNAAKEDYALLVLRLIIIICLVCLNTGNYFGLLSSLLNSNDIKSHLPLNFWEILFRRGNRNFGNVLAEALRTIENPLIIVVSKNDSQRFFFPEALVVDMNLIQCREDVVSILFPKNHEASQIQEDGPELEIVCSSTSGLSNSTDEATNAELLRSEDMSGIEIQNSETENKSQVLDHLNFWHIIDAFGSRIHAENGDKTSLTYNAPNIKLEVESCIQALEAALTNKNQDISSEIKEESLSEELRSVLDELKQDSVNLNRSEEEVERIKEVVRKLTANKSQLQPFLDAVFMKTDAKTAEETVETSAAPTDEKNSNKGGNEKNKGKGKSKSKKSKKRGKGKGKR